MYYRVYNVEVHFSLNFQSFIEMKLHKIKNADIYPPLSRILYHLSLDFTAFIYLIKACQGQCNMQVGSFSGSWKTNKYPNPQ